MKETTPAESAWPARVTAGVLLLLGFIPWAAFLPGRLEVPGLATQLRDWTTGTLLTAGIGLLAWLVSRGEHWPALSGSSHARPRLNPVTRFPQLVLPRSIYLVAVGSLILYAAVATFVFSRKPLLIDEVAQLWQAQRYAEGQLWVPVSADREFFSFLHLVDIGKRAYAQFPPGGPFMLWLGVLLGAPWLVGPVCGALSVLLFARLARVIEPFASARWVVGATLLFAVTPFGVFMFGSHMNHATALFWILVAVASLAKLTQDRQELPREQVLSALVMGLGFGAAATIRPIDAFAFALPAAVWLVMRAGRSPKRWTENIVAFVGVAIPFAAMMYVNVQTTGHPLRFGYEVLWGTTHGLGFHAAPWGEPHTPLRGLALASLYQWRLQSYLFETPFPSLLLPLASLLAWRRVGPLDRYLLASSTLVVLFYLLYWHDGFYLGPRFVFPLLPVLVLWTARLSLVICDRVVSVHVRRALAAVLAFGVVGAAVFNLPVRIAMYRAGLTSMRTDYAKIAAEQGVHDALVFVRESWGAQLVARLWALGVSRPMSELVYRNVDTCHLEQELTGLERDHIAGGEAERRLGVLLGRDSSFVTTSMFSPDSTERVRPGARYTATCLQRIEDDRAGYLHFAPLRLITTGSNLYARDLHARDSLLIKEYSSRPLYLLRRVGTRVDGPLVFIQMSRDSLLSAWRVER